ncbi:MAG TPA: glycosyltransferase [Pedococcus sp.]|jgi:glycosyltransferase involved in cell wall biosynthesis|uniref:glycosyltransferase n=1 Tax=Pedococcus sp. TaxID=2860345 RepID=UPI002F92ED30
MSEQVIYVVRSWPRLSQTFIVNEVLALEQQGVELAIFSLARSGETLVQPQVARVHAPVVYLEDRARLRGRARLWPYLEVLADSPTRFVRTALFALRHRGLADGYGECTTRECFAQAVLIARAVTRRRASGDRVAHLHAHFAHDPALVGLFASRLAGLTFSFTAHARDLLQIPPSSLAARAAGAVAVVTCCEANAGYISSAVPAADRPPVSVVHHGVDLRRFAPVERRSTGDDRAPAITSIGRLVEKKGFDDLLRALALLATGGLRFTCRIYGDGPLLEPLTRLRDELDLAPCVEFMGARDSDEVVAALAHTDVFALTPRVTEDGDRDGIPNVLVEAMASAVPVVTTSVGGVPELVQDGVNGAMVPPGDPSLIAQGLATLLADPDLRARMGTSARATVEDDYDVNAAALRLAGIFGTRTAAVGVAP